MGLNRSYGASSAVAHTMHPLSWILRGHAKFKPFLTFINEDAPSLLELHQGVWCGCFYRFYRADLRSRVQRDVVRSALLTDAHIALQDRPGLDCVACHVQPVSAIHG